MSTKARRRLLTIGHSYAVAVNRRLAHESPARGDWDVTVVAPARFRGDFRWHTLSPEPGERCFVEAVPVHYHAAAGPHHAVRPPPPRLAAAALGSRALLGGAVRRRGGHRSRWTPPGRPSRLRDISEHLEAVSAAVQLDRALCAGVGQTGSSRSARRCCDRARSRRVRARARVRSFRRAWTPEFAPDEAARRASGRHLAGGERSAGRRVSRPLRCRKGRRLLTSVLDAMETPVAGAVRRRRPARGGPARLGRRHGRSAFAIATAVSARRRAGVLNAMDVLCAPSQTTPRWREQFGRMLIEAFASGVPVVASRQRRDSLRRRRRRDCRPGRRRREGGGMPSPACSSTRTAGEASASVAAAVALAIYDWSVVGRPARRLLRRRCWPAGTLMARVRTIRPLTVPVCPDFLEERWPSMDLSPDNAAALCPSHSETSWRSRCGPLFRERPMRWSAGSGRTTPIAPLQPVHRLPAPSARRVAGAHDVSTRRSHLRAPGSSLPADRTGRHLPRSRRFRSTSTGRHDAESGTVPRGDAVHPGGLRRASAIVCDSSAIARRADAAWRSSRRTACSSCTSASANSSRAPRIPMARRPRTPASVPRAPAGECCTSAALSRASGSTCSCTRSPPCGASSLLRSSCTQASPYRRADGARRKAGDRRSNHRAVDARRSAPGGGSTGGRRFWRSVRSRGVRLAGPGSASIGDGRCRQRLEGPPRNRRHRRGVCPSGRRRRGQMPSSRALSIEETTPTGRPGSPGPRCSPGGAMRNRWRASYRPS